MARQTVSPLEQHIEKGVLALTGLLVLVVAMGYLFRTPNTIEIKGRSLGPGLADEQVKQQAERLARRLREDTWPAQEIVSYSPLLAQLQSSLLTYAGLPTEPIAPVVSWGPLMPKVEFGPGERVGEPKILAEVVPPSKPLVVAGRSTLVLRAESPAAVPRGGLDLVAGRQEDYEDKSWATIVTLLDEKKQREKFLQNHYDTQYFRIDVVAVHLERQEQRPDGTWGDWEKVRAYQPYGAVEPPAVRLVEHNGRWILPEEQNQRLRAFIELIRDHQSDICAPVFPQVLFGDSWDLPKIEGIDWELFVERQSVRRSRWLPRSSFGARPVGDFPSPTARRSYVGDGAVYPRPAAGPYGRPPASPYAAGERAAPSAGRGQAGGRMQAAKDLRAAREALKAEDWQRAVELAQAVLANPDVPSALAAQAQTILEQAGPKLQEQERKRQERLAAARQEGALPSLRPVWVHDLTVVPGRTYRWRVKFALLNSYVGNARKLKNRQDAERVVIESDWSEPSEPVTIEPDLYFYLTSVSSGAFGQPADKSTLQARIEAYKWMRGRWIGATFRVGIGQPIVHEEHVALPERSGGELLPQTVRFDPQAVVVDIEPEKTVRVKTTRPNGTFAFRQIKTACLVYEDASGHLLERQEHLDRKDPKRKELRDLVRSAKAAPVRPKLGLADRLRRARSGGAAQGYGYGPGSEYRVPRRPPRPGEYGPGGARVPPQERYREGSRAAPRRGTEYRGLPPGPPGRYRRPGEDRYNRPGGGS